MRARLAAPLLVLSLAACGGGGPAQTQVVPSTPKGTVWGQVFDAATQGPLAGASVSLAVGDKAMTAKTGKDGSFQFTGVPAGGQAAVTLSMSGYTEATIPFGIPATAGNFPVNDTGAYIGPIGLFPATGVIHAQVIGYDGTLLDGADVNVSVPAAYVDSGAGGLGGWVSASGKTSDGAVDLTGLPAMAALAQYGSVGISVSAGPVDTNGDGVPEYLGNVVVVNPADALKSGGHVTVTLPAPGDNQSLQPLSSNVGSIFNNGLPRYGNSILQATDPVRVIYNQPVDPSTLLVSLFDDTGASIATTTSVKQGNVVEVAPKTSLAKGGAYYVHIQVRAAGIGTAGYYSDVAGWFFVPSGNTTPVVASEVFTDVNHDNFLDAGDRMEIVLDRAVGRDLGGGSNIAFYLNVDLDGSGTVGDATGEDGSGHPIFLQPEAPGQSPNPGLTRRWFAYLPSVPPATAGGVPYQFGPNTSFAYDIDFPDSPGVLDAEGQPLQATTGQFTVSFASP